MPTQNRPDLHPAALELIRKVNEVHQHGSGRLSLEELAVTAGRELAADDADAIRQRGDLVFTRSDASGGVFENQGPELERRHGSIKVSVPPLLKGVYRATDEQFILQFDHDHTVSGSVRIVFVISASLHSILVDRRQIVVGTSVQQADLTIIHG